MPTKKLPHGQVPRTHFVASAKRGPFFAPGDITELAEEANLPLSSAPPEALATRLDDAASEYVRGARLSAADTPGTTVQWAHAVERHATALLQAFGIRGDFDEAAPGSIHAFLREGASDPQFDAVSSYQMRLMRTADDGWSEYDAVSAAICAVQFIRRRAVRSAEAWEAKKGGKRTGDSDEVRLVAAITEIYVEAFARRAGRSRAAEGGQPTGPWLRFTAAVMQRIADRVGQVMNSDCADEEIVARLRELASSPEAIIGRRRQAIEKALIAR